MRFSTNWLRDYVDVPPDQRELVSALSMLGLVVDDATPRGEDLQLDLDIPSNRPDVMNHFGVARELAATLEVEYRPPRAGVDEGSTSAASLAAVEIEDAAACPRYAARVIVGVSVEPSPPWLCERLEAIGLRPVNNVADVTNFVLWEMGHPLHAFDLDKLSGAKVIVRRARDGERLTTLDSIERRLVPADLVIADAQRPVALAGVMGGADTAIEPGAQRLLLEGALFEPTTVRRMAKRHGTQTDASHRFERGLAFDGMLAALDRAAALIADVAGGEVCSGRLDVFAEEPAPRVLELRTSRVERLLGAAIDRDSIAGLLRRLSFEVTERGDDLRVTIPSWRGDVQREVDLIEEVARLYGYDRLVPTLPTLRHQSVSAAEAGRSRSERRLKRLCTSLNFWEAMTFTFTSETAQRPFRAPGVELVPLAKPLSESMAVLRPRLGPGLLSAIAHNLNHGVPGVRLFELGRCFEPGEDKIVERSHLALVACGPAKPRNWASDSRPFDFSDLSGALATLTQRMKWPALSLHPEEAPGFQSGACAGLTVADRDRSIGTAGRVANEAAEAFGIDIPVWLAEIDVDDLLQRVPAIDEVNPLPRFPAAERDLSLLLRTEVSYAALAASLEELDHLPLETHELVDVYVGDDLPAGHRSLTLRLVYRAAERTLTSEEIEDAHQAVVDHLQASLGASQR